MDDIKSAVLGTSPPTPPTAPPPAAPPPFVPPPFDGSPFPPDPPPPPQEHRARAAIVAVALVVVAALVGAGLGVRTRDTGSRTASGSTAAEASDTQLPSAGSASAAADASLATDAIVSKVDPAVVDITTTLDGGAAAGTGMVLTPSGLVLTNNHVIEGATTIGVQIAGKGPTHSAHVVGYDATDDVALVQIEGVSGLATISVGDTSTLSEGDQVVTIGNAQGKSGPHAVSSGTIVALDQTITANDLTGSSERLHGLIQIDAGLQPGDSGGPLVNDKGEVIGVNTAASSTRRSSVASEGFAIPIDKALDVARQIQAGHESDTIHIGGERAVLGVEVDATGQSPGGVTISGTQDGSSAADAGLEAGDTITGIDGASVRTLDDLQVALDTHSSGDQVSVRWVDSSGSTHTAQVKLMSGPPG